MDGPDDFEEARARQCVTATRTDWSAIGEAAAPEIDNAEYADLDAIVAALPPEEAVEEASSGSRRE